MSDLHADAHDATLVQDEHRSPEACPVCRRSASPYLSAEEAAEILRLPSVRALYRLAARGVLPGARKFGRRLLVRRRDLIRTIEEGPRCRSGRTER